jgi:Na+-translocating ferredoxin:NAD+ oxidoreductase RnfC subunit
MLQHGVKLEQEKTALLKNGIRRLPAPQGRKPHANFSPAGKDAEPAEILRAAQQAGIVDELSGKPLAQVLELFAEQKTDFLVACGFDDDSVACAEQAVLREEPEKVTDGLRLAAKACGADENRVAAASGSDAKRFSQKLTGIPAFAVGKRYPAACLLTQKLGRSGKKAALLGIQACTALSDAVCSGIPQEETVLTVAGDAVDKPGNYRVTIGTSAETVLKAAKMDDSAQFAAVGSVIAGRTVRGLSFPITVTARCLFVQRKVPKHSVYPCVKCGRCARACPVGIIPWLVHRELESSRPDSLLFFHVEACIGCNACGLVCPSGIELAAEVRRAAAGKKGSVGA